MIDSKLYQLSYKLSLKFFKGNTFLAEEATHNALISCFNAGNSYKPFVMQAVYNECRNIAVRGHFKRSAEFRAIYKTVTISETSEEAQAGFIQLSEEDLTDKTNLPIEDKMYATMVAGKVYESLSKIQKKIFDVYMETSFMLEGAEDIGMNYNTFKAHIRIILNIFKHYGKYGKLPLNKAMVVERARQKLEGKKKRKKAYHKVLAYKTKAGNEETAATYV